MDDAPGAGTLCRSGPPSPSPRSAAAEQRESHGRHSPAHERRQLAEPERDHEPHRQLLRGALVRASSGLPQPFGGGRASGTNDKAGAAQNLLRWTSARSIKETFVPATDHRYPHMG